MPAGAVRNDHGHITLLDRERLRILGSRIFRFLLRAATFVAAARPGIMSPYEIAGPVLRGTESPTQTRWQAAASGSPGWEGNNGMFQHILVPLDGSASDERAVNVAARFARAAGGVVTLLRVVHPYWEPGVAITGDDFEAMAAAAYLEELRQRTDLADVASSATIAVGSVVPAILRAVQEDNADLIVLCQHGRTPLVRWARSWAGGGIAQQVARRALAPVLVLHEEDCVVAAHEAAPMTMR